MKKSILPAVVLAASTLSCSPIGDEPNVYVVRLALGLDTVRVRFDGEVNGAPIVLTVGNARTMVAATLLPDGTPDPVVTPSAYELRVTPSGGNVTYTPTASFEGTLNSTDTDTTTIRIEVVKQSDDERIFGAVDVDVHARE